MPSVVAISPTVTQPGCGVEIGRDPRTVQAKIFGGSVASILAATGGDQSEQMAVETSIRLAQNVFAIQRVRIDNRNRFWP
jgi:hypothetical protein